MTRRDALLVSKLNACAVKVWEFADPLRVNLAEEIEAVLREAAGRVEEWSDPKRRDGDEAGD